VKPARTVILDNEAVQALAQPSHHKHRRTLAIVEAATSRNLRRAGSVTIAVPTAVQVEAGWNRRAPRSAALNRLRVERPLLDGPAADTASAVVIAAGVSVADAHLAVTLKDTPGPHAVITSDEHDIRRGADHVGVPVTIVTV
jgi:predicted nucleic acid-binding protein